MSAGGGTGGPDERARKDSVRALTCTVCEREAWRVAHTRVNASAGAFKGPLCVKTSLGVSENGSAGGCW